MLAAINLDDQASWPSRRSRRCKGQRSAPVGESSAPSDGEHATRSRVSARRRSSHDAWISHSCADVAERDCDPSGASSRVGESGQRRSPPLLAEMSPARGEIGSFARPIANRKRCRDWRQIEGRRADLPPCGGDVRQDRGALSQTLPRCPDPSPLHLPRGHAVAGDGILAVLQLHALRQQFVADAVGLGPVLRRRSGRGAWRSPWRPRPHRPWPRRHRSRGTDSDAFSEAAASLPSAASLASRVSTWNAA